MLTWESFEETDPMENWRLETGMMDSKWIALRGNSSSALWIWNLSNLDILLFE